VAGGHNGASFLSSAEIFTQDEFRPDATIRLGAGPAKGDGIHNVDGTGQTIGKKTQRRRGKKFVIGVENDGNVPDSFTVHGPGRTSKRWVVAYVFAGVNVTSQVRAGAFDFDAAFIDPGGSLSLTLRIKPKSAARPGSRKSVLVTVTSGADPGEKDAVKAKLTVKRA